MGRAESASDAAAPVAAASGASASADAGGFSVEVMAAAPAPLTPDGLAPVLCIRLVMAEGATVADALRAAGVRERLGAVVLDSLVPSVWGRACALDQRLRARDRIELTRPLQVDPKEARRLRYQRDGVRKPARRTRG